MAKSIIIIGAGIAGLAAGCYGQMNGYQTKIFELHELPGGLCTSWKRKGYTVDGCIQWLVGSNPNNSFYRVWEELGAIQGREIVYQDEFFRIEGKDGKALIVYSDADRLEKHLKDLAPEDSKTIEQLMKAVRDSAQIQMPIDTGIIANVKMFIKMLPVLKYFRRYGKFSIQQYAKQFQNPYLRETFAQIFDIPDFSMIALIMSLGWKHTQAAGYPVGGSLDFAQTIEQRYFDLGGEINYKSRVVKILTEQNRAVGIKLADGSEHRADIVISAADGHATIFDMLGGQYLNDEIKRNYREMPIFQPLVHVAFGVNRDFSNEPHAVTFPVPEPLNIAGELHHTVSLRHYCYDPTVAPQGKSVLAISFFSNYAYWEKLGYGTEAYRAEKENILSSVISVLEQRFPGIKDQIEVTDVATPITFERYTGNWQGSMEGWLITPKTMTKRMPKTLPGLENLYMIGQWVKPGGGVPTAAITGRDIIRTICKGEGKKFRTTLPQSN
ncbi:MAG TPA: NAD(P)/FAD-dependent oxidoreductase [Candidatus Deferrimicrobium sp.]|nr:NAD(P)/FAD-dependent oxidoreductase [Candidatus Deferrimicrobium sp.]